MTAGVQEKSGRDFWAAVLTKASIAGLAVYAYQALFLLRCCHRPADLSFASFANPTS